ncbi:MAG: hypothetical protein KDF54_16135, partial [Hydrogenophaga sp.]|nr:hypothetical protein [Hydrogenophaga sp.]
MTSAQLLAGHLVLRPGAPLPGALQSSRRDWAPRLTAGQPASAVPGLLASLFSLCGQAHRLCSQLALAAAAPGRVAPPADLAQRLRLETAQEHVRRIGLDWPRLLAGDGEGASREAALASLRSCPLLKAPSEAADPWTDALDWLKQALLQMSPDTWLRAWQAGGADWLGDWSRRQDGWLPALLRLAREDDAGPALDGSCALRPHRLNEGLHLLADDLSHHTGFAMQPTWQGVCAHTGTWSRAACVDEGLPLTPWALLGCRLAELVRLCLPDGPEDQGAAWLRSGVESTGPDRSLAWVEMARGLLVHQVEIDDSGDGTRVRVCRVLAPTEWNFHAEGEVARRVSALDAGEPATMTRRRVGLLMAAFDPCVPFE